MNRNIYACNESGHYVVGAQEVHRTVQDANLNHVAMPLARMFIENQLDPRSAYEVRSFIERSVPENYKEMFIRCGVDSEELYRRVRTLLEFHDYMKRMGLKGWEGDSFPKSAP